MTEKDDEVCTICGGSKDEHEELNHEFNLNNELITKDRSTPKRQPQRPATVVGAIDIDLRKILLKKGIISNADFAALYDPGASASGDRETGEAPSSG